MSRVGRRPIPLPPGVSVTATAGLVTVAGPRGTLRQAVSPRLAVDVKGEQVVVARASDERKDRALHGLTRSLIANMVTGVSEGFQKSLDLVGVGYRAQQSGKGITLQVGYAKAVEVEPPPGITLVAEGANRVHVQGADKQLVGEMAARIRRVRPPNAYTGKGVRYVGEVVRVKPGKAAGRSK
ncbi:MAG: 50S ribosomal protein L6 [Chloroflexi bacterium]|nr:50S ribosomal protein L6 [Chloroflexota bacterium]